MGKVNHKSRIKSHPQKGTKIKKIRKRRQVPVLKLLQASLKYQGKIFFAESTLHGVRYIAETDRPIIERLMWFICVLIGAIATVVIIVNLWEKFQTNPTITGLDTDFHNWIITFPAVSICPNKPGDSEKIKQFVDTVISKVKDADDGESERLNAILNAVSEISWSNMEFFMEKLNERDLQLLSDVGDLKELIYSLMTSCEDFLITCEWKGESYNCCSGFFPVFTEVGFCYTFNARHYEAVAPVTQIPYPEPEVQVIKETDPKWAIKWFIKKLNYTVDESLLDYNISIYIHHSHEVPGIDMKPQYVWNFKADLLLFSMRETYTTENAQQLSIKQRHCIFNNEVKLTIDDTYSFTACMQQCRVNNAQRICGCVPHFYPRLDSQTYRNCKLEELNCIATNIIQIENAEKCACELGCSNVIYEVDKLNILNFDQDLNDAEAQHMTELNRFECEFTSWPMIKYKREVLFGWVDLLVSFGGIAGLFLGFSLLSGVEIIYYFTIRTCCMMYKQEDELVQMVQGSKPDAKQIDKNGDEIYFVKLPKDAKDFETNVKKMDIVAKPLVVKPLVPANQPVMPPFGIDYKN